MTPDQIKALPVGSVVLDHRGCAWQKHPDGGWVARFDDHTTGALADDERLVLIHDPSAAPEPDHSMCARLVEYDTYEDGRRRWRLQHPDHVWVGYLDDDTARLRGYAIPEPEPSVVERAAEVLNHVDLRGNDLGTVFAEALDAAGLLVKDGEQ